MGGYPLLEGTIVDKKPRLVTIGIVMDPDAEVAYLEARHALDTATEMLLKTYPDRVKRAMLLDGVDVDDIEARKAIAERVIAEDTAELTEFQDAAEAAVKALEEATQQYKFRSLGRKTFRDLVRKHPATDDDHELAQQERGSDAKAQWNEDGLARELLHLASVSPSLTVEKVDEMFDGSNWNDTELLLLKTAALGAQLQGQQV